MCVNFDGCTAFWKLILSGMTKHIVWVLFMFCCSRVASWLWWCALCHNEYTVYMIHGSFLYLSNRNYHAIASTVSGTQYTLIQTKTKLLKKTWYCLHCFVFQGVEIPISRHDVETPSALLALGGESSATFGSLMVFFLLQSCLSYRMDIYSIWHM